MTFASSHVSLFFFQLESFEIFNIKCKLTKKAVEDLDMHCENLRLSTDVIASTHIECYLSFAYKAYQSVSLTFSGKMVSLFLSQ